MFSDSIWIAFADKEVTRMTVWGGDFGRAVRLARMARFAFYTSDGVAYGCDGPSSEHQYIKLLAVKRRSRRLLSMWHSWHGWNDTESQTGPDAGYQPG